MNADGNEFLNLIKDQISVKFKVQSLMNRDGNSVFDTLKDFIIDAKKSFEHWTNDDIKKFKQHIIQKVTFCKNISKGFPSLPLEEVFAKIIEFFGKGDISSIDLIKGLGELIIVFANNQEKFLAISDNNNYENRDLDMLSKMEQNDIATLFGYDGKSNFKKGSILEELFSLRAPKYRPIIPSIPKPKTLTLPNYYHNNSFSNG